MKTINIIRDQKGFTLLELLVAVTLLAIGLLAVASMQATAINGNAIANRNTVISSLAQEVMEDIVSWKSSPPPADARLLTTVSNANYPLRNPTIAGAGTFSAVYSVTPNNPVTQVSKIDVTVTGANKTVTLTCYKRTN